MNTAPETTGIDPQRLAAVMVEASRAANHPRMPWTHPHNVLAMAEAAIEFVRPKTGADLARLLPDAAIEEVGHRRELVIYTGLCTATHDRANGEWTEHDDGRLVPMPEYLD